MRSYEAARTYFSILGVISWIVIVLGGVVALFSVAAVGQMSREMGGSGTAGLAGVVPGLVIMFAGFMGLVFVQIGRAGVDTAEYTQQMLKIARDQLEVSRQGLKRGQDRPQSFSSVVGVPENAPTSGYSEAPKPAPDAKTNWREALEILGGDDGEGLEELIRGRGTGTLGYKGEQIEVSEGQYLSDGKTFVSLERAVKHIDHKASEHTPLELSKAPK